MEFIVAIGLILIILELRSARQEKIGATIIAEIANVRNEHAVMSAKLLEGLKRAEQAAQQASDSAKLTSAELEEMKREFEIKIRTRDEDMQSIDSVVGL
jgi:hypothetical protein